MQKSISIAVANQKGGVGKTTTTVNVATALAAVGYKVLLIDLDPQGNASTGLGVFDRHKIRNCYDLINQKYQLDEIVYQTIIPNLHLIPASNDLAGIDHEYANKLENQYILKKQLRSTCTHYDYMLIDCPPALNLLTINALTSVEQVLIPLQCEYYALEGLVQLINTIQMVQKKLNPTLTLMGIALTMFDKRSSLAENVIKDVRKHFSNKVFNTIIPRNVKVSEAPSHGQPVLIYDVKSAGSLAYMELTSEIIKRHGEMNVAA